MKTKTTLTTKAGALLNLLRAIGKAAEAGGETIGIEDGVEPLISAVNLGEQIVDGSLVKWDETYKGAESRESQYGEFLGYIVIANPHALNTRNFPVRRTVR